MLINWIELMGLGCGGILDHSAFSIVNIGKNKHEKCSIVAFHVTLYQQIFSKEIGTKWEKSF